MAVFPAHPGMDAPEDNPKPIANASRIAALSTTVDQTSTIPISVGTRPPPKSTTVIEPAPLPPTQDLASDAVTTTSKQPTQKHTLPSALSSGPLPQKPTLPNALGNDTEPALKTMSGVGTVPKLAYQDSGDEHWGPGLQGDSRSLLTNDMIICMGQIIELLQAGEAEDAVLGVFRLAKLIPT